MIKLIAILLLIFIYACKREQSRVRNMLIAGVHHYSSNNNNKFIYFDCFDYIL